MNKRWVNNLEQLAVDDNRGKALEIIESGLSAIDTAEIVRKLVRVENGTLSVGGKPFPLNRFKRIRVIGFGKASCRAAVTLEEILGSLIGSGVVIDVKSTKCEYIETHQGTHPLPSQENVRASEGIVTLGNGTTEDDLFIVIVSGGGSALLCWPQAECDQGQRLYNEFLKTGGTIHEINTVRKHLSSLKGGGLAKLLYPASIVALIFCDIPGDYYSEVASGPTFKDDSSVEDAVNVLKKYNITQDFDLMETPKDDKYFGKVFNIPAASNKYALRAMADKAEDLGFNSKIISDQMYGFPDETLKMFLKESENKTAVIGGGESRIIVEAEGGMGGRCQFLAAKALSMIGGHEIFIPLASDGIDNTDAAGAIADSETLKKIRRLELDIEDYIGRYDTYNLFKQTGDLIFTGPTEANVSDLMLLLNYAE